MSKSKKEVWDTPMKNCPVCGRRFIPAPQHAYAIGSRTERELVCSYHCMRNWEKTHKDKRRAGI